MEPLSTLQTWAQKKTAIAWALDLATSAHEGQVDKAGVAYIQHPLTVAASLGPEDPDAVVVALLHDVLEDTSVTEASLAQVAPRTSSPRLRPLPAKLRKTT